MNHINSYARKKLASKMPYETFRFFHRQDALDKFDAKPIQPNGVILRSLGGPRFAVLSA